MLLQAREGVFGWLGQDLIIHQIHSGKPVTCISNISHHFFTRKPHIIIYELSFMVPGILQALEGKLKNS